MLICTAGLLALTPLMVTFMFGEKVRSSVLPAIVLVESKEEYQPILGVAAA